MTFKLTPEKEKKRKSPLSPELEEVIKYFGDSFKAKFGEAYIFQYPKDLIILRDMLKMSDAKTICNHMRLFFRSNDEFVKRAGYTIGVFKGVANRIVSLAPKESKSHYKKLSPEEIERMRKVSAIKAREVINSLEKRKTGL